MIVCRPALVQEFLTHWLGGVSLAELGHLLGYRSKHLTALLQEGRKRAGRTTIEYDSSTKRYRTIVPTTGLHGPKRVADVVTTLQAARLWNETSRLDLVCPLADVRAYRREPAPDVFRTLLAACTRRQVVDVTYMARTQQHTVLFSPHTLVTTTYRVHFRGYSMFEQRGEWRWWDLVPSRVTRAEVVPSSGYVGDEGDDEWHKLVTLRFRLHPTLSTPTKEAMRQEHNLAGDCLAIKNVREALAAYVAAEYADRRYRGHPGPAWEAVKDAQVCIDD